MKFSIKNIWPVLIIAIFNVSLHLSVLNNLEYHRDELLYFSLGQHPDFGYNSVPPMIGWLAWIFQNIFGFSLFAVRILPALMSGVLIILTARITKELGGSDYAQILSAVGMTVTGFGLRTFGLFMPVFIDLFFWTLCIFLIIRFINSKEDKYLIFFGIAAGLSLLNKYLIGLLFAGFLVIIPFTVYRSVFRNKKFWIGIIAGFLIFLPNLIWQFINGLPVIHHIGELARTQLMHVNRLIFLAEQLMHPAVASVLTITGFLYLLINKNAVRYRFLGIIIVFVVGTLMLLQGKSYYTIGIFPLLIAMGAVSYDKTLKRAWARILLPVLIILLTIPLSPVAIPIFKSEKLVKYFNKLETAYGIDIGRRFEDNSIHSLPQDYADMLGWEELTAIANEAWQKIPDKKAAFIYGENYGQAGAITIIGKKYKLPEAVSFNESFVYWFPEKFDPDITSMVYINDEPGEDIQQLFRKITRIGSITNPDAREFGTAVYLCEDPVCSFNEFWIERTKNLK